MDLGHTANCEGLSKIVKSGALSTMDDVLKTALVMFTKNADPPADCNSLAAVADKIINRKKTGGRRLEQDKPLNVAEAQANLDKALQDPAIRARVEKLKTEVADENARLVYQAAVMDEEGYYGARDLLIQQLLQRTQ
jgi:hypothetical protein